MKAQPACLPQSVVAGSVPVTVEFGGFGNPVQDILTIQRITLQLGTNSFEAAQPSVSSSGASRFFTFTLPPALMPGTYTLTSWYQRAVQGRLAAGQSRCSLRLDEPLALRAITPQQAAAGQSLSVKLTASRAIFTPGEFAEADFGPGISVGGGDSGQFGPLSISQAGTAADASLLISPAAESGPRTVHVRVNGVLLSLSGFNVLPANRPPALIGFNVQNGAKQIRRGVWNTIQIQGENTHFMQGKTTIYTSNALLNLPKVIGPTMLSVDVSVPTNAPEGSVDIVVITDSATGSPEIVRPKAGVSLQIPKRQ